MENLQNLFDTLVANLPTIVMVFFGIVVLWNLIGGYRKGTARQATRMLTVVLSFLICFYGFRAGAAWLQSQIEGVTVGELLARYEGAEGIFSALPEAARSVLLSLDAQTAEAVLALPLAVVVLPVAFTVMFLLLCLVTKFVYLLLILIGGLRKKKIAFGSRLCGMLLGAVQGVAIAVVLLMPAVGILNVAGEAADTLKAEQKAESPDETTAQFIAGYDTYARPTAESPFFGVISKCGAEKLYSMLATMTVNREEVDLRKESVVLAAAYPDLQKLSGADFSALTPEQEEAMRSLNDRLTVRPYYAKTLSGVLRCLAESADNGTVTLPAEEPFLGIMKEALSIFRTSNETNLNADMNTVLNVYFLLSDNGAMAAFGGDTEAAKAALTRRNADGKTVINLVIEELNGNVRTKPLVTSLTKLSVSIMASSLGLGEDTEKLYENVKSGVTEVLSIRKEDYETDEEYVGAVAGKLDETLTKNGIEVEQEIVDKMAAYVAENYAELPEITDDNINEVLLSYYDAYLDYTEKGTIPEELPQP